MKFKFQVIKEKYAQIFCRPKISKIIVAILVLLLVQPISPNQNLINSATAAVESSWEKIYETTDYQRNFTYATGYGIGASDRAAQLTNAGATFTRVKYRMEMRYSSTLYYAEVSFDKWEARTTTPLSVAATITNLALPTGSNDIQTNVSNCSIESNWPGFSSVATPVTTGSGKSCRLEMWSGNYSTGASGLTPAGTNTYDYDDVRSSGTGHGSFQIHNLTDLQTILAWNKHGNSNPDLGFGSRLTSHSDWTNAGSGSFDKSSWKLQIYVNSGSGSITTPSVGLTGQVGVPFNLAIDHSGFASPTFSYIGTLPGGLVLDPSTGVISGTPTESLNSLVRVTATDSTGQTAETSYFSIQIFQRLLDASGSCSLESLSLGVDVTNTNNLQLTKVGRDCIAEFLAVGSYSVRPPAFTYTYLVVAGGGGGADGGGGGGGGLLQGESVLRSSETATIAISVGAGGAGGVDGNATNGANSSIGSTLIAIGGGEGGPYAGAGSLGGSGGGTGGDRNLPGAGTVGQGNAGGGNPASTSYKGGGGGGGAGGPGLTGTTNIGFGGSGGAGGPGVASTITGSSVFYAGGGGGGINNNNNRWWNLNDAGTALNSATGGFTTTFDQRFQFLGGGGSAGVGGGGRGSSWGRSGGAGCSNSTHTNGEPNTGGGGGGTDPEETCAGNGGSGIVILRWASQPVTLTFSPNNATSGQVPSEITFRPGQPNQATAPANAGALERTGMYFAGWNTRADGGGNYFIEGNSLSSLTTSTTLFAIFRFQLNYNLNGGSGVTPSSVIPPNGSVLLAPMDGSTKDGDPFLGWCAITVNPENCYGSGRSYPLTSNTTLYALYGPGVTMNDVGTQIFPERLGGNSETITATGGYGVKTFSVTSPTSTGFTIQRNTPASTTTIRISPTVFADTYTAIITATDSLGNRGYETTTILVRKPAGFTSSSQNLKATVGTAKTFSIPVMGGIGDIIPTLAVSGPGDTSTITIGEPAFVDGSLKLNVSNQTQRGRYQITITLRDDAGLNSRTSLTLDVKSAIGLTYQALPGAISQESLTVHWQINSANTYLATGSYLNDLAGGSNATIRGPTTNPRALLFSGQDPLYEVGDPSYLQLSADGFIASNQPLISETATSYSLFAWIFPQGSGSLISLCATNRCDTAERTSIMELSAAGDLSIRHPNGVSAEIASTLSLNQWHYLGFTIDSATSTLSASINGQLLGDISIENGAGSSRSYLALGASAIDSMTAANAGLGQFRFGALHLYSIALDSATVVNNFTASKDAYISAPGQQVSLSTTEGIARDFGPFRAALGSGAKTFALEDSQSGELTLIAVDSATVTLRVAPTLSALDSVTAATYFDTITVTDQSSSIDRLSIRIDVNPPVALNLGESAVTLATNTTYSIPISVVGGNGSKTLSLTTSPEATGILLDVNESNQPILYFNGTTPKGSYSATVTATDQSGAIGTDSLTAVIDGGISVVVSPSRNISIYPNETKTVTLTPSGGIAPYSYQRLIYSGQAEIPITFETSTGTLNVASGLATGSTTLESIVISDSQGESVTVLVSIRVASVPTIAGADVLQFTYGNFTSVETFTVSSAVNLSSATSQSPNLLSGLRMKFYNDPTQSIYALAGSSAPSGSPCFTMSSPSNLDFTHTIYSACTRPTTGYAEGYFIAPITGTIIFSLRADDKARLQITTDALNECIRTVNGTSTCSISGFTAGESYPLKIWFLGLGGNDDLKLYYSWSNQGGLTQSTTIIPISAYSHQNLLLTLTFQEANNAKQVLVSLRQDLIVDSTTVQNFVETITVTNEFGQSASKSVNIVINPPISAAISRNIIDITAGSEHIETVTAINGTGAKTFTIANLRKSTTSIEGTGLSIYVRNCTGLANTKCDVKSAPISYLGDTSVLGNLNITSFSGSYRGSSNDNFTIYAEGYYRAPVTGQVVFNFNHDDSIYFEIEKENGTQTGYAGCCNSSNPGTAFTITDLTEGQLYPFKIWLNEVGGNTYLNMYHSWSNQSGSTQARTIVPIGNFYSSLTSDPTQTVSIEAIDGGSAHLKFATGIQGGTYFFNVVAVDEVGAQATLPVRATVVAAVTNNPRWAGVKNYSLMNGTSFLSETYTVTGGSAPYQFQIISSDIFEIVSAVDTPTGRINVQSNSPLSIGSYSFSIKVIDSNLRSDSMTVTVEVSAASAGEDIQSVTIPYGSVLNRTFNLPERAVNNPRTVIYPALSEFRVDTSTVSSRTLPISVDNTLSTGIYIAGAQYRLESESADTVTNLYNTLGIGGTIQGVVADSSGNWYIADYVNDRIKKYNPATGEVSVYAGSGVAADSDFTLDRLSIAIQQPCRLALDNFERLLVSTCSVGRGQVQTSYLMRINLDGSVEKITGRYGGSPAIVIGGLAVNGGAGWIHGQAVDSQGHIYIVGGGFEAGGQRIFLVHSTTGILSELTIPSSSNGVNINVSGQSFTGIAIDKADNLFIVDVAKHRVIKYSILDQIWSHIAGATSGQSGSTTNVTALAARFNQPRTIAIDPVGDIWIGESGNNRITLIERDTNFVRAPYINIYTTYALAVAANGDLMAIRWTGGNNAYFIDRKVAHSIVTIKVEKAPAPISLDLAASVDISNLRYGSEYPIVIDLGASVGELDLKQMLGSTLYNSLDCNSESISESQITCRWIPIIHGNVPLTATFTPSDSRNYSSGTKTSIFSVNRAETFTVVLKNVSSSLSENPNLFTVQGLTPLDRVSAITLRYSGISGTSYESTTAPTTPGTYQVRVDTSTSTSIFFAANSQGVTPTLTNYLGYTSGVGQWIITKAERPPVPEYPSLYVSSSETFAATVSNVLRELTYQFSSPSRNVCTVDPATGSITALIVGYCDVTLTITSDNWSDYFNYSSVTFSLAVTKSNRTVSITSLSSSALRYGQSATASIQISSARNDGVVSYTLASNSACSVTTLANFQVRILATKGSGSCTIVANISEGEDYVAASSATLVITISKADAPIFTVTPIRSLQFSGAAPAYPTVTQVQGLVNGDQLFSYSFTYSGTRARGTSHTGADRPTRGGTYMATLSSVSLSGSVAITVNYNTPIYPSVPFQIFRVEQPEFSILTDVAFVGTSLPLSFSVSSPSEVTSTYEIVSGGSASGCSIENGSISASSAGTCLVRTTRPADDNYEAKASPIKTITFRELERPLATSQAAPSAQETITIGVQGGTGLNRGETTCTTGCVPTITSISPGSLAPLSLLTITGTNFNTATEIIFNRRYRTTTFQINSDTEIVVQIPAGLPAGAGSLSVVASGGTSFRFSELIITS